MFSIQGASVLNEHVLEHRYETPLLTANILPFVPLKKSSHKAVNKALNNF